MRIETQKLRMLINHVDAIMKNISSGAYESQDEIRAALREALQKTEACGH